MSGDHQAIRFLRFIGTIIDPDERLPDETPMVSATRVQQQPAPPPPPAALARVVEAEITECARCFGSGLVARAAGVTAPCPAHGCPFVERKQGP